jgi:nucleoid-associated protein YgaU
MNRYQNISVLVKKCCGNVPYYKSTFYPNIPLSESDVYVITTVGDRLDSLAYSYYRDSTLWWVISMANNNITKGALYPAPGTQLRIPSPDDVNSVLEQFNQFNQIR